MRRRCDTSGTRRRSAGTTATTTTTTARTAAALPLMPLVLLLGICSGWLQELPLPLPVAAAAAEPGEMASFDDPRIKGLAPRIPSADPCRSDPTWRRHPSLNEVDSEEDLEYREECALKTHWTPRSALWEGKLDRFEGMVLAECVEKERDRHLQRWEQQQEEAGAKELQQQAAPSKLRGKSASVAETAFLKEEMRVVRMYPADTNPPLAVEIANAWTEDEVAAMNGTATCLRRYQGESHFMDRHFAGGGNLCTCAYCICQSLVFPREEGRKVSYIGLTPSLTFCIVFVGLHQQSWRGTCRC
jgi:hypothetical protein